MVAAHASELMRQEHELVELRAENTALKLVASPIHSSPAKERSGRDPNAVVREGLIALQKQQHDLSLTSLASEHEEAVEAVRAQRDAAVKHHDELLLKYEAELAAHAVQVAALQHEQAARDRALQQVEGEREARRPVDPRSVHHPPREQGVSCSG